MIDSPAQIQNILSVKQFYIIIDPGSFFLQVKSHEVFTEGPGPLAFISLIGSDVGFVFIKDQILIFMSLEVPGSKDGGFIDGFRWISDGFLAVGVAAAATQKTERKDQKYSGKESFVHRIILTGNSGVQGLNQKKQAPKSELRSMESGSNSKWREYNVEDYSYNQTKNCDWPAEFPRSKIYCIYIRYDVFL